MNFLEKLDFLMENHGLNKSSLSHKSQIPYTTIDNWYKRGYDGLKLTTLKKLNAYFHTTLDFWILDEVNDPNYGKSADFKVDYDEMNLIRKFRALDEQGKETVKAILDHESRRTADLEELRQQLSTGSFRLIEQQNTARPRYYISYYRHMLAAESGKYRFDELPTDLIGVPDTLMAQRADFVLEVNGDSMEPAYRDGDKVFVKKAEKIPDGSIGVFSTAGECFIKELRADRLISHNKKYPDIPVDKNIRFIGTVLGKVEE